MSFLFAFIFLVSSSCLSPMSFHYLSLHKTGDWKYNPMSGNEMRVEVLEREALEERMGISNETEIRSQLVYQMLLLSSCISLLFALFISFSMILDILPIERLSIHTFFMILLYYWITVHGTFCLLKVIGIVNRTTTITSTHTIYLWRRISTSTSILSVIFCSLWYKDLLLLYCLWFPLSFPSIVPLQSHFINILHLTATYSRCTILDLLYLSLSLPLSPLSFTRSLLIFRSTQYKETENMRW